VYMKRVSSFKKVGSWEGLITSEHLSGGIAGLEAQSN